VPRRHRREGHAGEPLGRKARAEAVALHEAEPGGERADQRIAEPIGPGLVGAEPAAGEERRHGRAQHGPAPLALPGSFVLSRTARPQVRI
jgi:hypothetical protein